MRNSLLDRMRSNDFCDKTSRPNSQWKIKEIISMSAFIYYRNYLIGSENSQMPDVIRKLQAKITFPKSDGNVCFIVSVIIYVFKKETLKIVLL